MKEILYIEDDLEIGTIVKEDLEQRGYLVRWLTSGEKAEEALGDAEVVILDVMLPGLDGFTVGQRLKRNHPNVSILMLSARTAVDDKLQGLHFADDYVTKPFHPEELAARIEVLFRRNQHAVSKEIQLDHLTINMIENRILKNDGEEIFLTAKQHQIFMYFLRHPNQVLTKEQLYEAVWGESYLEGDKTLMVHIRYLREKIEQDPSAPKIVETIRGIGYRVKQ
ncbi:response regulator transcription factor [Sporosarcina limicola]|uniref:DNA-binding response OmpR family regulator n=1 Tax=Sporosarcina limicola TaxID=34101 RepID=A0A927MLU0_9BACL|nr:response regulator transcription factor [Sporosarcina limicola]MBE1557104.1 DNA-binding response OmpR family regulator [Sporosarcina limicola]